MQHADFLDAFRREGDAFTAAAHAAGLDAAVPTCPGWSVADLVGHVGRLHRWMTAIVAAGPAATPPEGAVPDLPARDQLLAWFEDGRAVAADALAAAGPQRACWSWTDDHTSGFWARRQTHELAIHRVDAQAAAGTVEPVEHDLAIDGIQECFDMLAFRRHPERRRGQGETVHLHCTDGQGEWFVRLDPDGFIVTREHAKGDVAARGRASDLLLFLWGRAEVDALEVFGDAALLVRWRETLTF